MGVVNGFDDGVEIERIACATTYQMGSAKLDYLQHLRR
jgi:hypothetical protein